MLLECLVWKKIDLIHCCNWIRRQCNSKVRRLENNERAKKGIQLVWIGTTSTKPVLYQDDLQISDSCIRRYDFTIQTEVGMAGGKIQRQFSSSYGQLFVYINAKTIKSKTKSILIFFSSAMPLADYCRWTKWLVDQMCNHLGR